MRIVLFMPIESALNAALTTDKDLLQYSIEKKVILATPTTLLVVLKSFALICQQHNMTENAMDIMNTPVLSTFLLSDNKSTLLDYSDRNHSHLNGNQVCIKGFVSIVP